MNMHARFGPYAQVLEELPDDIDRRRKARIIRQLYEAARNQELAEAGVVIQKRPKAAKPSAEREPKEPARKRKRRGKAARKGKLLNIFLQERAATLTYAEGPLDRLLRESEAKVPLGEKEVKLPRSKRKPRKKASEPKPDVEVKAENDKPKAEPQAEVQQAEAPAKRPCWVGVRHAKPKPVQKAPCAPKPRRDVNRPEPIQARRDQLFSELEALGIIVAEPVVTSAYLDARFRAFSLLADRRIRFSKCEDHILAMLELVDIANADRHRVLSELPMVNPLVMLWESLSRRMLPHPAQAGITAA